MSTTFSNIYHAFRTELSADEQIRLLNQLLKVTGDKLRSEASQNLDSDRIVWSDALIHATEKLGRDFHNNIHNLARSEQYAHERAIEDAIENAE
jgi:hypothetical protein